MEGASNGMHAWNVRARRTANTTNQSVGSFGGDDSRKGKFVIKIESVARGVGASIDAPVVVDIGSNPAFMPPSL